MTEHSQRNRLAAGSDHIEAELGVVGPCADCAAKRHIEAVYVHCTRLRIQVSYPIRRLIGASVAKRRAFNLQYRRPEQSGIGVVERARVAQEWPIGIAVIRKIGYAELDLGVNGAMQQLTGGTVNRE